MPTLMMMKGLPGSGKTHYAKNCVENNPINCFKRVSKDDLRLMIDGGRYSKGAEKVILQTRNSIVEHCLLGGYNVIVDDTNLEPYHEKDLREIAKDCESRFEVVFMDTPLSECLTRNAVRPNPVPQDVIMNMYNKHLKPKDNHDNYNYLEQNEDLPKVVICDLDGTVALRTDRHWTDYDKVGTDKTFEPVADLVRHLDKTYSQIIFVSGRDGSCYPETTEWIIENLEIDPADLILLMRPVGDRRKDSIVKKEIFERYIKYKFNVLFVLDDRNQVVDMWRKEVGLPCLQVNYGDF